MKGIVHKILENFPGTVIEIVPEKKLIPENGKKEGFPHGSGCVKIWNSRKERVLEILAELLCEAYTKENLWETALSLAKFHAIGFRGIHSKASAAVFISIAHKVNNKLTPVIAYAQLLESKYKDDKFSRITYNAKEASDILSRTMEEFTPLADELLNIEEVSVILKKIIPGKYKKTGAYADPFLIGIVFEELKRNANRHGGASANCWAENGKVVVQIKNPGNIEEEVLKRAFEPFFSTDGRIGLGLNLVHGVITKFYRGRINLKNEGDETVAEISFPFPERGKIKTKDPILNKLLKSWKSF